MARRRTVWRQRVTVGTATLFRAAVREGVVARLESSLGDEVGMLGRSDSDLSEPDVVARHVEGGSCEVRGKTLLGNLFLSVLAGGGL